MRILSFIILSCCLTLSASASAEKFTETQYDPFVGDWLPKNAGDYVAQVFATGSNAYQVNVIAAFDDESSSEPMALLRGARPEPQSPVELRDADGTWTGTIRDDCCGSPQMEITNSATKEKIKLSHFMRPNPRLRAKAPEGAAVLFADHMRDGVMKREAGQGTLASKDEFAMARAHIEFRMLSDESAAIVSTWSGAQLGLFAHFGRNDKSGCGTLLTPDPILPNVRAERAILEWQAFDIEVNNGRVTVFLNGVKIHDNVACVIDSEKRVPFAIESRGAPVEFRNIWVLAR